MPLILGTNSVKGGYDVANSLRFNSGSSDYLVRTMDDDPTLATKATMSYWFKRTKSGAWGGMGGYNASSGSGNNNFQIGFNNADYGYFWSNSPAYYFYTSALQRDSSAWKHVVVSIDTTQATAANRVKYYENGVQVTSFVTANYPGEDDALNITKNGNLFSIGRFTNTSGTQYYYDGYFAEVALVDGLALAPTDFGEFDEDSPTIWKPKNVSGLTFGNNGFYLEFKESGTSANSSGLGADTSGNDHHFTVNNLTAVDQSTDTCTNNFATMNPLNVPASNAPTFAEGNLETESATTGGQRFMGSSTIGVAAGKWYAECKILVIDSSVVGVSSDVGKHALDNTYIGSHSYDYSILAQSGNKYNNDNGSTHGDAFSANDILMIALDMENENVYFGRNGNWFDGSGNADESSPNSALSLTTLTSTPEGAYFFASSDGGGSAKAKHQWNFGNAPYSISSGNTDGNGYGNFEYAVPSGYFALCTKNLAEYG